MPKTLIKQFFDDLDQFNRKLIEYYIDNDYVPKVRTGQGKKNNFFYEHNSKKGIEIAREIIKFKKMQFNSGYLTFNSKKHIKFVTKIKNNRYKSKS